MKRTSPVLISLKSSPKSNFAANPHRLGGGSSTGGYVTSDDPLTITLAAEVKGGSGSARVGI